MVDVVCDCGGATQVWLSNLRSGRTSSCGCLAMEILMARNTKHGMSESNEHQIWCGMWQRCGNPNEICWRNYGGRGIKVHDRWRLFENFLADMGPRPPGMSLDRIDVNGNYEPGNVRWATTKTQRRNGRVATKLDESKAAEIRALAASGVTRRNLAAKFGVARSTIRSVIRGEIW